MMNLTRETDIEEKLGEKERKKLNEFCGIALKRRGFRHPKKKGGREEEGREKPKRLKKEGNTRQKKKKGKRSFKWKGKKGKSREEENY